MDAKEAGQAQGHLSTDMQVSSTFKLAINYRRSDTQGTAWALYLALANRFGEQNVFFDNGSLRPGDQFRSEIQSRLAEADALIVLIGMQWMPSLNQHQRQAAEDYVVMEIDLALRRSSSITIIPVLVDDAEPPDEGDLPLSLKALSGYQVERLRHTNFLHDAEHLIGRLAEISARPATADEGTTAVENNAAGENGADQSHLEPGSGRDPGSSAAGARQGKGATTEPRVAPPPDDDHYRMIVRHADHLVVFLGADVNADDREQPWRPGSGMLPDDHDLAGYIASRLGLSNAPLGLAAVAQYAGAIHGEIELFDWVKEVLRVDSEPGRVHRDLAKLPAQLGMRYQMIVTPKYDAALEKAFREAGEAFDVAVYVTPRKPMLQGTFAHLSWNGPVQSIDIPNRYQGFPIGEDGKLDRPVIVRINGAVDDPSAGFTWEDNYVITEDHYIGYLSSRSAEEIVPGQILAKLRRANWLFLGYSITDWRLRVFLQRIFDGPEFGRAKYWAVASKPDPIERDLWHEAGATLYQCSLTEYLAGLHAFLASNPAEGGRASG